ncbi:TRAP transporter small permease subunit [Halarcobacter ebronensis]|uniref:C4-dicarboxylate ABC transporter permease n=1 Tax=Halarcobacter ebronensis TaxID=1462615 RepID=A0A4Q1AUQ8_9BACT|nr:TRAP transporter small permease [Halarcobacter ebronensis]QKF81585.1 TRAP transporter, small permease subunit [Halarcobacter ebronensis]RXK05513.1 C4-dicarboxylate ABC transporter permease [Halarcobacter ebronensis]
MQLISHIIDRLCKVIAYLSGLLLISLVLLILCEIFLRAVFNTSTMIADEYSGYLYLASIFLGISYTFLKDGHIRINILTSKLSNKTNRYIDIYAGVVTLLVFAFIAYRTALFAYDSYSLDMLSEAVSETPLYLTQIVMPLGAIFFILAAVSFIIKRVKND